MLFQDFFTAPEAQARMTDLRKRLQYFALAVQSHTKKLNEGLKAVKDAESDEASSPCIKDKTSLNIIISAFRYLTKLVY